MIFFSAATNRTLFRRTFLGALVARHEKGTLAQTLWHKHVFKQSDMHTHTLSLTHTHTLSLSLWHMPTQCQAITPTDTHPSICTCSLTVPLSTVGNLFLLMGALLAYRVGGCVDLHSIPSLPRGSQWLVGWLIPSVVLHPTLSDTALPPFYSLSDMALQIRSRQSGQLLCSNEETHEVFLKSDEELTVLRNTPGVCVLML